MLRICKIWFGHVSLSGCWDIWLLIFWGGLPLDVVFHWRSSSNGCPLQLEVFFCWSSVFHWSLSSVWGRLPMKVVFHWMLSSIGGCFTLEVVFHLRLSSIGGCLQLEVVFHCRLSSIGGRLPLEVVLKIVFILRICKIWFGHLSSSLKFEYDPISGCWDIPLLIFGVVFQCRSSSFETFLHCSFVPLP